MHDKIAELEDDAILSVQNKFCGTTVLQYPMGTTFF